MLNWQHLRLKQKDQMNGKALVQMEIGSEALDINRSWNDEWRLTLLFGKKNDEGGKKVTDHRQRKYLDKKY